MKFLVSILGSFKLNLRLFGMNVNELWNSSQKAIACKSRSLKNNLLSI